MKLTVISFMTQPSGIPCCLGRTGRGAKDVYFFSQFFRDGEHLSADSSNLQIGEKIDLELTVPLFVMPEKELKRGLLSLHC